MPRRRLTRWPVFGGARRICASWSSRKLPLSWHGAEPITRHSLAESLLPASTPGKGQNVANEVRRDHNPYDPLPDLEADLVHLRVGVMPAAGGMPAAPAAKTATRPGKN
jgi:hypothetical protein